MVTDPVSCTLCGLPTTFPISGEAGQVFCCPACREVSALLAADVGRECMKKGVGEETAVATTTVTLSLSGLWCPSCAWLIRESLQRAPGVQQADVSFVQREAQIKYDPAQTNMRGIRRQVKRLGYRAWATGEKPHDEEEAHWMRLLVSGVFAMHVMVLSFMLYLRVWTGRAAPETEWLADFFQLMILIASVPVILILGLPILRAGLASLLHGRPNTHTLIALGAFSAFALSLRNYLAGSGGIYFDTAAILLFLVALGRWFEIRAQKISGQTVEKLLQQVPPEATWITPDGDKQTPPDELPQGARVRVRPGERFPVDAIIAVGEGDVDESLLTGEPEPVSRRPGDRALAGTVSLDGAFEVITSAVGPETVVGQIGRLLHQALWQRAPVEQLADRLAALMVPTAVLLSAITFAFWTYQVDAEAGLIYALSVLLIACPCALGIATPLTLWLGLGRAAEAGIILRNTGVLERLAGVEHVFFDKTGTLTKRPLRLQAVATDGVDENDFLAWITAVEIPSEHPLGQAIVTGAQEKSSTINHQSSVTNFRTLPGQGVTGMIGETAVWVGSCRLMATQSLELSSELSQTALAWQRQGLRIVYAGWNGRVTGLLGLGETMREETAVTISRLQRLDLSVAVLTGDDKIAGERWQKTLGVPVFAEQLPEDKVARLRETSGAVAMIGDGINDGPALAAAAVGLSVSQGSDVAQSAADAVMLGDDLRDIPWLITLARASMRKVRQNLAWAFVYNIVGLGLAVSGQMQPELAALLMVASNIIVTSNALRLRKIVFNDLYEENDHPLPEGSDRLPVKSDYQIPITEI